MYVTHADIKAHLLDLTGELLRYEELPEALEFRQSENLAKARLEVTAASAVDELPDLVERVAVRVNPSEPGLMPGEAAAVIPADGISVDAGQPRRTT